MLRTVVLFSLVILLFGNESYSQVVRNYTARKISSDIPIIDGQLEETNWKNSEWQGNFTQFQPANGKNATQRTEFAILYDDNNIYVGIKAYDTSPDSILRRLTMKDELQGDMVGIAFDSYHDKLTSFVFEVSAAGIKTDYIVTNDGGNNDYTWEPIWYVKTSVNSEGWVAEMRIPLTQLRFEKNGEKAWGLEVVRRINRYQEMSIWQPIPKDGSGMVHFFGELSGINGIKPKRQVEIAPYIEGQVERFGKEEGNPYMTGKSSNSNAGIDGKIGITNNIIMDFSVNPDFGQVEADPSQVNLTAYETYRKEQRPFFIEGKNIYSFPLMIGDGDMSNDNLFYSRRIGRSPQYVPDIPANQYIQTPGYSHILGAAKISGKTKNGLSIGFMENLTGSEYAETDSSGFRRKVEVEPLTNYFVGRVQKDFKQGMTVLGAMFTATNRDINTTELNFLARSAYTGGLDFAHYWDNRNWYFAVKTVFSKVSGSRNALITAQESSARYFQRPDRFRMDSTRTSLIGQGGRFEIGKQGGGKWTYGAFVNWKSPGLELNDMGYMRNADFILQILYAQYQILQPKGIFRSFGLFMDQYSGWDFDANLVAKGLEANARMQFTNYWTVQGGFSLEGTFLSNSMLRGGPYFKTPGGIRNFLSVSTDERKKLLFLFTGMSFFGDSKYEQTFNYNLEIQYRPIDVLQLSLIPGYMTDRSVLQYVDQYNLGNEKRYLFAKLDQHVLNLSFRMNLNLLPNLNIQYWGQPFVASGKYSDYKKITNSRAGKFSDSYQNFSTSQINYDAVNNIYSIDEYRTGNTDYNFTAPDFNDKEFLSNLVLKWEYIPGSYLYLVWSQRRDRSDIFGTFSPGTDMRDLFTLMPHNVWMIKLSYRFSL